MKPSILYVGSLSPECNSFMRYKTLGTLGVSLAGIDTDPFIFKSIFSKIHYHWNIGPGVRSLNKIVLAMAAKTNPGILLVDNKTYITARTIKKLRKVCLQIKVVNLLTDDPEGLYGKSWRIFRQTVKMFDLVFVQRKVNINELRARGAIRVALCLRSFDPQFHRVVQLTSEERKKYHTNVGFIGNWEEGREEYIMYLVSKGIPVKITGNDWQKGKHWNVLKNHFQSTAVYGDEYVKVINGMDIALHFLRHANRDEQDSRTFEIPACGSFMLAERSETHLSLFEEGKEAAYFASKEELLDKVLYYLENEMERKQVARAGHARCLSSGYSHSARLQQVLQEIAQLPQACC